MDKKQYILKMLEALESTRPLARWLKILVQSNDVNDTIIDLLINTFQETIKNIQDEKTKEKLQHASSFLEELKNKEAQEKKQDELDIEKLEELFAKI